MQTGDDRKFEYKTFPTVFKVGKDSVELLEPNRSYRVPWMQVRALPVT
jgi:hypothetical protein